MPLSIATIRGRKKKADAGTEVPKHTELPLFRVLLDGLVTGRILEAALRKGFGWFVLAMGAFVLIQRARVDLRGPIALASPEPPSLRPQSAGSSLAARA